MKNLYLFTLLGCGLISGSCQSSSNDQKMNFEEKSAPIHKTKKQKTTNLEEKNKNDTAQFDPQSNTSEDFYQEGDIKPFNEIYGVIKNEISSQFQNQITQKVFIDLNLTGNWKQKFSYLKISDLLKNANDQLVGVQSEKTALEDDYSNASEAYEKYEDEDVAIIMSRYPGVSTMTDFYNKYDEESKKFARMERDLNNAIDVLKRRKDKMDKEIEKLMTQKHFLQKLQNHHEARFNTTTKMGRYRVISLLKDIYGIE